MEIKDCQAFVIAELKDAQARIEELETDNTRLQRQLTAATRKHEKAYDELLYLWKFEFKENNRLRDERERLQSELNRSIEQMAELESQMQRVCDRYNALARETTSLIKDFEPVKIGGDDGE